jgi:hypothetical protein
MSVVNPVRASFGGVVFCFAFTTMHGALMVNVPAIPGSTFNAAL